jgi:hypothetical protein
MSKLSTKALAGMPPTLQQLDIPTIFERASESAWRRAAARRMARKYLVRCREGCGSFGINEVVVVAGVMEDSYITFRCPMCNELQSGHVLVIDK